MTSIKKFQSNHLAQLAHALELNAWNKWLLQLLPFSSFSSYWGNTAPTIAENKADITNTLNICGSPNGCLVSWIALINSKAGEENSLSDNELEAPAATCSSGRSKEDKLPIVFLL